MTTKGKESPSDISGTVERIGTYQTGKGESLTQWVALKLVNDDTPHRVGSSEDSPGWLLSRLALTAAGDKVVFRIGVSNGTRALAIEFDNLTLGHDPSKRMILN